MYNTLVTFGYGFCIFSYDVLLDFLRAENIRTKKVLQYYRREIIGQPQNDKNAN